MTYWKVHQNIFFTKGYNRTLVFDSLKGLVKFIPNELYNTLLSKEFIFRKEEIELEYFEYLESNNLIFSGKKKLLKRFTKVDCDFSINFDVGICVIELSKVSANDLFKLIDQDDNFIGINQFNFIFGSYTTQESIINFIDFIDKYEVDLIELTLVEGFNDSDFLFSKLNDINRMFVINNFLKNEITSNESSHKNRTHASLDTKSLKIFPNLYSFFESKFYNIYFYNKIFISRTSDIKNSNNTEYIYGNLGSIAKLDLKSILKDNEFTRYWYSPKANTIICRDCEFQNFCSDNRTPIFDNKNNYWYHEKECEYNPFISKWNDEVGYFTLENSGIVLNDSQELEINFDILNKVNGELWESDSI
jgi:hypothetical protein